MGVGILFILVSFLLFKIFYFNYKYGGEHLPYNIYLTREGYDKMKADLEHLRAVERPAASAAIAEARDKGDLSENAEYDAAKEAQALLEARIAKMESAISSARIIDSSNVDTDKVQILTRVRLLNTATGKEMNYQLVSENEANFKEGKLSIGTPIAQALIGHSIGDVVEVVVPAGKMSLKVLDITI